MPLSLDSLPFLNRFRPLAYILVVLAIAAISFADASVPLFLLATAAALFSWWLVERPHGIPLPRALINLGVLAASCGLFYELVLANRGDIERGHPNLLLALGHFMIAILLCKLFEKKSNRDYAQILTLTLLLMVTGAIVATASLFFAILLAVYLALGLYAILLFHLRAETERAIATASAPLDPAMTRETAGVIRKDIRLVAAWSAVLLVAIAAVVFLLFPRSSAQDFFANLAGSTMSTGFSDQVRMRDFVHLHPSDALVMEVKLEQAGVNIGSEGLQPYFRGLVLETYDAGGRKWIRSERLSSDEDHPLPADGAVALVPPAEYNHTGAITQTYTMEMPAGNTLFAMAPPTVIWSDQLRTVDFSRAEMIIATHGPLSMPLHYSVLSPVVRSAALFPQDQPTVTPGDLGVYRLYDFSGEHRYSSTVPEPVSKLAHDLAHDLLPAGGGAALPAMIPQIAQRFQTYLEKTYPYSLNFQAVNHRIDPTADFLLNHKATGGHCEFFASALVMMCRAVGINARMATGYHGGEFNSIGGFYVVKQKFAHAWAEVFVPHRGWTIYDPSPVDAGPSEISSLRRWFQEVSEVMQKAWLSTVVAFDNSSRTYLFDLVSGWAEEAGTFARRLSRDVTLGLRDLLVAPTSPWWLRIEGVASMAAILGLAGWLVRSWNRRRTSQIPRILRTVDRKVQRQLAHDLMFFDDLARLLARLGGRKTPAQTPLEYVNGFAAQLQSTAEDARWLIGTFYDIRFGTLRMNGGLRQEIDAALGRVRRAVQHPADAGTVADPAADG